MVLTADARLFSSLLSMVVISDSNPSMAISVS